MIYQKSKYFDSKPSQKFFPKEESQNEKLIASDSLKKLNKKNMQTIA